MLTGEGLLREGKAKSQHGNRFSRTEMRNSEKEFPFPDKEMRNAQRGADCR